jgi:uncharacterized protein
MSNDERRQFLKTLLASIATGGSGSGVLAAQEDSPDGIPKRPLGNTGEMVSIVGLGGFHIARRRRSDPISIMHEAIDNGMTFFDNCWEYHFGRSEELMGRALATGGRRDKVFLMSKFCARDYTGAKSQLEDSLRRLKTDHLDLWQFHQLDWKIDARWIQEDGALRYALEAKEAGKVRHIGFTAHRNYENHLRLLDLSDQWAACQMPINCLDAHFRSFQENALPQCQELGVGVIGMKGLAGGVLPRRLKASATLCRRYSLSLPISTMSCGIETREDLRQDLAAARNFQPLTEDEILDLLNDTKAVGEDGKFERYKTGFIFDSPLHSIQHWGVERPGRRG